MKFKTIELPVVDEDEKYKEEIEKRMKRIFKEKIYLPLLAIINGPKSRLENDRSALTKALETGKISHVNGLFKGKFSASISRELKALGAEWTGSGYRLNLASLPKDVRMTISRSESRFLAKLDRIDNQLAQIVPAKIAESIKTSDLFDTALFQVGRDIHQTLKSITVEPQLSDRNRKEIADGWANNMNRYIEDFAKEEIQKLRLDVSVNAFQGNRYESLIKTFQTSYGVTEKKAKFLARQETNLLMAEFKKSRYIEAGVPEYRWDCVNGSPLHPVRPMHKALDGKIFSWNNPPITSEDGSRNNPGQDFGCRCKARPILRRLEG